ncbi:50S ribosomal protein L30 [Treponema denticola]|uniref:50S ribosomal protein L30 n=1 Tax=Treponema denticola TaxID=158 RepID=UPI0020A30A8E|nr:50S ribosomal protein L30 [Treponema denticola]UTD11633.1 50S ribosomal protein L30 [Treponema denticola]
MAKRISIKLIKSTIGQRHHVRATVRSLGLKKINSVVEHEENPAILGMVKSIAHVVEVKELN